VDLEVSPRKRACWISHTFIMCSVSAAVFVTQVPHGYRTVEALARGIARTPPAKVGVAPPDATPESSSGWSVSMLSVRASRSRSSAPPAGPER
jgi:hypothetical protein